MDLDGARVARAGAAEGHVVGDNPGARQRAVQPARDAGAERAPPLLSWVETHHLRKRMADMTLASFIQFASAGTARPDGATSMLTLEAKPLTVVPSVGSTPATENMVLFGFSDEGLLEGAEGEGSRSYDVLSGSEKVLEASGRPLSSVRAVLVINGTVQMEPPNFRAMLESEEISATVGSMFAQHDGLIVKYFLASRWGQKNRGGGCYFFQSTEEVEKYLSSDFWNESAKDTPWEDVTYEMFSVVDAPD